LPQTAQGPKKAVALAKLLRKTLPAKGNFPKVSGLPIAKILKAVWSHDTSAACPKYHRNKMSQRPPEVQPFLNP